MTRYVFTSANRAYRDKVFALAESVKRHEPEVRFVWAVVEHPDAPTQAVEAVDELLRLNALDRDWSQHLRGRPVVEACTAVKGAVLKHLLQRPDCEAVVYLDPDIYVYGSMTPVWEALVGSSIVLTPHLLAPSETDQGIRDNEISALKHGIYNLGFLAVAPSRSGLEFADWWDIRLWDYCVDDPARGLFTDQRWIDHVPVFFDGVQILRHEGCNVASWNLGERVVAERDGGIWVGAAPLVFWHFSSVDHQAHLDMTDKYARSDIPRKLSEQYRTALGAYRAASSNVDTSWSLAGDSRLVRRARRIGRGLGRGVVTLVSRSPLGSLIRSSVPKRLRDRVRAQLFGDQS